MKTIIILAALVAIATAAPADTYDSKYDNLNVQEIISNERLFANFTKCLLDKGPCTPEGTDIKKIIPEALKTSCGKCTPKQMDLVRAMVHAIQEKSPEQWKELSDKHDPKRQYEESFKKFLAGSN